MGVIERGGTTHLIMLSCTLNLLSFYTLPLFPATRFDYTSLLNIVCQKVRINLPEYQPCGSEHGGFAYRCRVHQTWYEGKEFSSTKKDAKHECAKWAILGMDIPGIGKFIFCSVCFIIGE